MIRQVTINVRFEHYVNGSFYNIAKNETSNYFETGFKVLKLPMPIKYKDKVKTRRRVGTCVLKIENGFVFNIYPLNKYKLLTKN